MGWLDISSAPGGHFYRPSRLYVYQTLLEFMARNESE